MYDRETAALLAMIDKLESDPAWPWPPIDRKLIRTNHENTEEPGNDLPMERVVRAEGNGRPSNQGERN